MVLQNRRHRQAVDLVRAPWFQLDEFNAGSERSKVDREAGIRLLTNENVAHRPVAAVNPDHVAGNIGRREKREPHDVVPMRMRQKYVEPRFLRGTMLRDQRVSELAHPRPEIAQHILVATGFDLDAARIAAVGAANREREFIRDEAVDRLGTVELVPALSDQRVMKLAANRPASEQR